MQEAQVLVMTATRTIDDARWMMQVHFSPGHEVYNDLLRRLDEDVEYLKERHAAVREDIEKESIKGLAPQRWKRIGNIGTVLALASWTVALGSSIWIWAKVEDEHTAKAMGFPAKICAIAFTALMAAGWERYISICERLKGINAQVESIDTIAGRPFLFSESLNQYRTTCHSLSAAHDSAGMFASAQIRLLLNDHAALPAKYKERYPARDRLISERILELPDDNPLKISYIELHQSLVNARQKAPDVGGTLVSGLSAQEREERFCDFERTFGLSLTYTCQGGWIAYRHGIVERDLTRQHSDRRLERSHIVHLNAKPA